MAAYYNEHDPYAAQWLRNLICAGLIAAGEVDERDIQDVGPDDLDGFTQCHFFAGVGGWSRALRLAGWPDDRPVWTGSCPCQPFSSAARGRQDRRQDDQRHLWPHWHRLIVERSPVSIFGEQIAQSGDWFDEVSHDLEKMGYAVGAAILPACSIGLDHARSRLYFVGDADRDRKSGLPVDDEMAGVSRRGSFARSLVPSNGLSERMAILQAFGNAIVPTVAAEFIAAYRET